MKKTNMYRIALASLSLLTCARGDNPPLQNLPERSRAPQEAVESWKDLRFGMFIHWGPVTLTGHEIGWSRGKETPIEEYDNLHKRFNPSEFNADEWVRIAKAAGMKYIVLTTKHHDGFCLWPSEYTDYDIAATPFRRDVVGELAAACRRGGIGFGAYYSTCDWHHPAYPLGGLLGLVEKPNPDLPKYIEYLKAQTTELVTKYGPLTCMWFDVPRGVTEADNEPTVAALRKLQPDLMVNNRAYQSATKGIADFDTPEQRMGSFNNKRPWETCMTIGRQWAWKPNDQVKTLDECLKTLIGTVGADGNFLFNVGPDASGVIEPEQVARLEEMGNWVSKYSEGIYGTRGGPFKPAGWGASTHKGNQIYLFIFEWPGSGFHTLPDIGSEILSAENLSGQSVNLKEGMVGYTLSVPEECRDPVATVIRLTLGAPAASIEPVDMPSISGSLAFRKPSRSSPSTYFGKPEDAFDDNPRTRWVAKGDGEKWLEVDLEQPETIDSIKIQSRNPIKPSLQFKKDGQWETIFQVEKRTLQSENTFPAITAQTFRLFFDGGLADVIEFQIFNRNR